MRISDWSSDVCSSDLRDALEAAETAELGPGDALYLPSLWWHGVSSLDEIGAMVNFWWRAGDPPHLAPINALYHAVITVKDLPPNERSEESRVGKGWVSTCRSGWAPSP